MEHPVEEAALRYVSLGLSVIPVRASKRPLGPGWTADDLGDVPAQERVASGKDVRGWYEANPSAGVAIVCGRVSRNLAVLDIDDSTYSAWIEEHMGPILSRTWTVRTGSGKLHIYIHSKGPVESHQIHYSGAKRAEIRAEGQYVLAPPSDYDFKGMVGSYTTIYGGPEDILTVPDSTAFFTRLITTAGDRMGQGSPQLVVGTTRILPPLLGEDRELLEAEVRGLRITGKQIRCIVEGPEQNEGDWDHCRKDDGTLNHSDIDFYIVCSLVEAGVLDEKTELIYATFPVGKGCYQNGQRKGSYGSKYLSTTLAKARKNQAAEAAAAQQAKGDNFEILGVTRVIAEPPHYDVTIQCPDGKVGIARGLSKEMLSENEFTRAVYLALNFVPKFQIAHSGKNFKALSELMAAMAKIERPVAGSTEMDYLRTVVIDHIRGAKVLPSEPEDHDRIEMGWRDMEFFYIRSAALIQTVVSSFRGPAPKPERLWEALRPMGGSEDNVKCRLTGKVTRVWKIPADAITRGG